MATFNRSPFNLIASGTVGTKWDILLRVVDETAFYPDSLDSTD